MAMLAEKRSKVKWTLNPRGKLWMNDEKKFGQKLMERMGWTKGKGLGKDQQGGLDPIRVMYKQDSKGLGFKWSNDDWIAHKDDFNAILANLNVVCDEKPVNPAIAPASLEEKSKSTKSRVHYHKFTRGKDMSRYSQEDLKCILAKLKVNMSSQPRHDEISDRPGFGLGYKPDEVSSNYNSFVGVSEQPQGYGFEPSLEQRSKPNIFVNLLSEFETETTKKRKRRIEEIDNETNEILEKSKKMKKEVTEKPSVRFNDEVDDVASREVDIVRKKEKKSKETDNLIVPDDSNEVASLKCNMGNEKEIKRKKKKNTEKEETLEAEFDATEQVIATQNKVKWTKE
ncbi:hypothetical protein QYM36_005725, partial [Artemia franciscana]